jgi:hypothetical protein
MPTEYTYGTRIRLLYAYDVLVRPLNDESRTCKVTFEIERTCTDDAGECMNTLSQCLAPLPHLSS